MEWEPEVHDARICFDFEVKIDLSRMGCITLDCFCLLKINMEDDSMMLNNIKEAKQISKK